ncbi:unnamed protein product [Urochloa decumbens]|uniref:Knottins-like domain-containing protein n=1 Tax=Urochloa decumbens TaxID=240449 RepID=A0ABC9FKP1_9POAL
MDLSPKLVPAILLLLLLGSTEMQGPMRVVVARDCQSPSHRYKGPCVRDSNCASVCQTEGFPNGKCLGFRSRCICIKAC